MRLRGVITKVDLVSCKYQKIKVAKTSTNGKKEVATHECDKWLYSAVVIDGMRLSIIQHLELMQVQTNNLEI